MLSVFSYSLEILSNGERFSHLLQREDREKEHITFEKKGGGGAFSRSRTDDEWFEDGDGDGGDINVVLFWV